MSGRHMPSAALLARSRVWRQLDVRRAHRLRVVHVLHAQVLHAAQHRVHERVHNDQVDQQQEADEGLPPQHGDDAASERVNAASYRLHDSKKLSNL